MLSHGPDVSQHTGHRVRIEKSHAAHHNDHRRENQTEHMHITASDHGKCERHPEMIAADDTQHVREAEARDGRCGRNRKPRPVGTSKPEQSSAECTANILPGIDTALNMACRGETGILRCLHSHSRTLTEGTVEQQAFASCLRQFMQQASRADVLPQFGVRRMQRSRNAAVSFAFRLFPQIDQHHVGFPDQIQRLPRRVCPTAASDVLLMQALTHVRGNRHVHHLRVGQIEAVHQRDVFLGRFDLQARIVSLLFSDGADGVTLVVVRGKYQRLVRQTQ